MLYRVKSSPLCRRSHRLIKRQNNGGKRRNSITAFPREKKKRERKPENAMTLAFLFDNAAHTRLIDFPLFDNGSPSLCRWKFNWKTEESFLPFRPSALSSIDKEIENAIAKFFFPFAVQLSRWESLSRVSNSTRDSIVGGSKWYNVLEHWILICTRIYI